MSQDYGDAIVSVMSDPYRTPGEVETIEQRRAKWQAELDYLNMSNAVGRKPEELAKMKARARELQRLLVETRPVPAPVSKAEAVAAARLFFNWLHIPDNR